MTEDTKFSAFVEKTIIYVYLLEVETTSSSSSSEVDAVPSFKTIGLFSNKYKALEYARETVAKAIRVRIWKYHLNDPLDKILVWPDLNSRVMDSKNGAPVN